MPMGILRMVDSCQVPAFVQSARDTRRVLGIVGMPQLEREGRVLGIRKSVHRVQLDRGASVPDGGSHGTHVSDGEGLIRVADHGDADTALVGEFCERVRDLQVDHAGLVDDNAVPRAQDEARRAVVDRSGSSIHVADRQSMPGRGTRGIRAPPESVIREERVDAGCGRADLARCNRSRLARGRDDEHASALRAQRAKDDPQHGRLACTGRPGDGDQAVASGDRGCGDELRRVQLAALPTGLLSQFGGEEGASGRCDSVEPVREEDLRPHRFGRHEDLDVRGGVGPASEVDRLAQRSCGDVVDHLIEVGTRGDDSTA